MPFFNALMVFLKTLSSFVLFPNLVGCLEFGPSNDGRGLADRYLDFAEEAERVLGRKVDLLTENSIRNPVFRSQVEADRKVLYEARAEEAAA